MNITPLIVGSLQTNCYIVSSKENNCIILDPGEDADFITETILSKKLQPQAILLTHGHYDHVLGCLELKLNFNIPIYLHQKDLPLYQNSTKSHTFWSKNKSLENTSFQPPTIDFYLADKQILKFGSLQINVIHTPGHTPGSCSFLVEESLFTGDTLFSQNRTGSTHHSYSSATNLKKSLQIIKSTCTPETLVYPGHEDYGFSLSLPKTF